MGKDGLPIGSKTWVNVQLGFLLNSSKIRGIAHARAGDRIFVRKLTFHLLNIDKLQDHQFELVALSIAALWVAKYMYPETRGCKYK